MICTCHRPELWLNARFAENVHLSWCPLSKPISDGKYGQVEYVISGAPSLRASEIEPAVLPIKRSVMRPDGSYGWTKKPVEAPARAKESYENNPRIVAAFKTHASRLRNTIRNRIRPHVASDTLALVTAQELEGDMWAKIVVKVSTFRDESEFTTWLHTIAQNTANDWIKAHKTFRRDGELLYDFTETENENGEATGGYPDARQDGAYTSTGRFIPTDPTIDSIHAAYLADQRRLIYRKPSVYKHESSKEWWAPESRELYLDACQQLRRRALKFVHPMSSKKAEGQRYGSRSDGGSPSQTGTSEKEQAAISRPASPA